MTAARVARRPLAGAGSLAWLALARLGVSLLGFAAVLVIARALAPAELGRWSLALAIQGYALHLGEFGLRSVVTTEAAHAGRGLLAHYLRLRLGLSALALAATLAGCALFRPDDLLLVGLATAAILPIALQLDWLALVDGRDRLAAALLLVRPLVFLLLLLAWPVPLGPEAVAASFLAAWMTAAVASWICLDRGAGRPAGPVPTAPAMLRRGAGIAAVTLSNQAQLSADLLLVGLVLGPAAAGDYYLAGQILVAALVFANAAGQLALARRAELGGDLVRLVALALAAALALAVLAPSLLPRLFGAEHAGAATLLRWLLPWFVLTHATTLLQAVLTALGREAEVLRGNLLGLALLATGLGLAALDPSAPAFALARGLAEAARLAWLWRRRTTVPALARDRGLG